VRLEPCFADAIKARRPGENQGRTHAKRGMSPFPLSIRPPTPESQSSRWRARPKQP